MCDEAAVCTRSRLVTRWRHALEPGRSQRSRPPKPLHPSSLKHHVSVRRHQGCQRRVLGEPAAGPAAHAPGAQGCRRGEKSPAAMLRGAALRCAARSRDWAAGARERSTRSLRAWALADRRRAGRREALLGQTRRQLGEPRHRRAIRADARAFLPARGRGRRRVPCVVEQPLSVFAPRAPALLHGRSAWSHGRAHHDRGRAGPAGGVRVGTAQRATLLSRCHLACNGLFREDSDNTRG